MAKHLAPSTIFVAELGKGQHSTNGTHDAGHNSEEKASNAILELDIAGSDQMGIREYATVLGVVVIDFAEVGAMNFNANAGNFGAECGI